MTKDEIMTSPNLVVCSNAVQTVKPCHLRTPRSLCLYTAPQPNLRMSESYQDSKSFLPVIGGSDASLLQLRKPDLFQIKETSHDDQNAFTAYFSE